MRIRVIHLAIALLFLPLPSRANYLGDIRIDRGNQAWLGHNDRITVSFSYKVDDPAGGRIMVLPYTNGQASPNLVWSGSQPVPQGEGSGDRWCSVTSGDCHVDQIFISLFNLDWSEMLLELYLPVNYQFGAKGPTDLSYSHRSPSWIQYGNYLLIDHHFTTDVPGYVFARPFFNGTLVPGYGASGGHHVTPPGGAVDHSFRFSSGPKEVNQVRIYMYNEGMTEVLWECFVPVDYHWDAHGLSNFTLDPESPQWMSYDERVTGSFDYTTSDAGGVRVFCLGARDGAVYWPSMYSSGSTLLPHPSGSGDRWFRYAGDVDINQACFMMTNSDQSQTYLTVFIPLQMTYRAHSVNRVTLSPGAPAILDFEERVDCDFHYHTTGANAVRVWPHPYAQGSEIDHSYGGSPLYSAPDGWGSNYFEYDGPEDALVDQVQFRMRDSTNEEILVEAYVPAMHFYGHRAVAAGPAEEAPATTVRFAAYPNPFNPKTTLNFKLGKAGQVRLGVFDIQGRVVTMLRDDQLIAGPHAVDWNGTNAKGERVSSGVYIAKLVGEGFEHSRKLILMR